MVGACGRTWTVTGADALLVWPPLVCVAVTVWLPTMNVCCADQCPVPSTMMTGPPRLFPPSMSNTLAFAMPVPLNMMGVPDPTTVIGEACSVGAAGFTVTLPQLPGRQ